jgi:cobalamin synthase
MMPAFTFVLVFICLCSFLWSLTFSGQSVVPLLSLVHASFQVRLGFHLLAPFAYEKSNSLARTFAGTPKRRRLAVTAVFIDDRAADCEFPSTRLFPVGGV